MQLHSPKPPIAPLKLPFPRSWGDSVAGSSTSSLSSSRSKGRSFKISRGRDDRFHLTSDSQSIEIHLTPWTFIRDYHGMARMENIREVGRGHVDLHGASVSVPVCTEVLIASKRSCLRLFSATGTLLDGPEFNPRNSSEGQYSCLLAGPCVYAPTVMDLIVTKVRHMELHLPYERSFVGIQPIRLSLYTDSEKTDMVESIPLGSGGNSVIIKRGLHQFEDLQLPEDVMTIEGRAFRFRCKDEATLWKVAIEDSLGSSQERWEELIKGHDHPGHIPKGYRGQYARLRSQVSQLLAEPEEGASTSCESTMLEKSLVSIEYLIERLSECKCRRAVDFAKEDTLLETRQLLKSMIKK